jgi:hypothetical protein
VTAIARPSIDVWCNRTVRHAILLVAVGCSGLPRVVDTSAAEDSVLQLEAAANAMASSDGNGALSGLLATLADGTAITGYPTEAELPPNPIVVTATCMPSSCTFNSSSAPPFGATFALTGTLAGDGDVMMISLTDGGGGTMADRGIRHWSISGSITLTATQLDGTVMLVHMTGAAGAPESYAELDYTVAYHAVRLDAQGCPIGGSLTATTTGNDSVGATNSVSPMINLEQAGSFGPCGTVH